jgi:3-oxoisoapionate-4-phosphate transcarboxylase/hydrolase
MYGDGEYCACKAQSRSTARCRLSRFRSSNSWRSSSARFSWRSVRTRSPLAFAAAMRVTYELDPPEAAATLALIESVGRADGPEHARGRVVSQDGDRAVLEFPDANWAGDVTLLVSSLLAGEWADSASFSRCHLVEAEWPAGLLPGPAFAAPDEVLVGAIVKPSLGLSPAEVAATAAALAAGGADLVKDDELLGDLPSCPLEERVRAVAAAIPARVRYAANVTGPTESLLRRAARAVELGAGALMVNAFAQGLDSLRALRAAELGVPIFAHRVGAAMWARGSRVGVAPVVVAELTRLCGADYVQVGSFTNSVYDEPGDVRAQIAGCHRQLPGIEPAIAVLGGGVSPENAADQVALAGVRSGVMVLLGSAAYADGSPTDAVRATVSSLRPNTALEIA